jgi:putative SOS response-associated peptidase YedK
MPTYEFWYDETNTYKAWFTADSKEHAKELIDQIEDGELEITELPDFSNSNKNYEVMIDTATEIEEN